MCPAFRLDIALSHLLEPVVSDGGRGVQAFRVYNCFSEIDRHLGEGGLRKFFFSR